MLRRARLLRHGGRMLASAATVAGATGVIYGLDNVAPILSLAGVYLFAVVPIALLWGLEYALAASLGSMLAFNFLFLPPLYTFTLADAENWVALAIYLVTAVVVSDLAARARRRAADAEQREREEALLAEVATTFLQGAPVSGELEHLAERVTAVLNVQSSRIELGPQRDPPPGESPYELRASGSRVGTLYLREGTDPDLSARKRFLPALASVLAVAIDHERLVREAVEAEALRRSDTIKTAVLRALSHDLQSPLTAIIASAETLGSSSLRLDDADRDALLETISIEAHRLERLVRDLLDLSRLEAGALEPHRELWTVDELVAQSLDALGPLAERVLIDLPVDLPPVRVDAVQVERALANLLENAFKFSPADEDVAIRATATRRDVIIRVVDRGPGIPADELERIFEPFYGTRAGSHARGSGLGLAITKGFAEANGGRAWVESHPGQGSSFALAFEAVSSPAPVEA